ncbi:flagellar associated protein [Coccomyxa subellipsoidea C-169]|uniref:Flagellar associated protein n=1 Tax=Coccomyxa subellipsoidea (strain C-169) TaxID=574566 RepID=I0YKK0_COCSC|nr:flagellar associated protein [Coccomyxa subellipsoidea C-169]EIE18919.1 flagellar associated protein [Coccomyxa subellipsoidea C-169]|eukprot:XP_005643463.1 flagellar associated protein [Coccomyxa subellipsoidea C-169]
MGLCYSCVDNASVEVVERFGKFHRIAEPGFNCICCLIGESVAGSLSLRVQQLDVRCETKTKDNVFVNVVVSVQYQVEKENLYSAFYKLTDSRSQITSYVFDVVRATVPKILLDDVFTTKEEIAHSVKEELTKSMSSFGFMIIQTLVTDIEPDMKVRAAMNEINAAQRMRVAAMEKAEAEKVQVVKAAEGNAEAQYLAGVGVARQRQAIVNGLRDSIKNFSSDISDVSSRDVIEMMMITQYFDMLKDVGSSNRNSTVFLPHSPGNIADISSQIRNGFLQGTVGAPPAPTMQR